jgi:hypothetical protein
MRIGDPKRVALDDVAAPSETPLRDVRLRFANQAAGMLGLVPVTALAVPVSQNGRG